MAKKPTKLQSTAPLFETLEPRLLLSADGFGAMAADAGLDHDLDPPQSGAEIALLQADDSEQVQIATHSQTRELVFVDPHTPDRQDLINDLLKQVSTGRQIDVILLDAERDGIDQITAILNANDNHCY